MKCAQCLIEYVANRDDDMARINGWAQVHAAETMLDGTAICLPHLERKLEEHPHLERKLKEHPT